MSDNSIPEVKIERPVEEDTHEVSVGSLSEEIKQFGRHLVAAFRSVTQSEEVQTLRTEIVDSFREIGKDIQETFEQTKTKEDEEYIPQTRILKTELIVRESSIRKK